MDGGGGECSVVPWCSVFVFGEIFGVGGGVVFEICLGGCQMEGKRKGKRER